MAAANKVLAQHRDLVDGVADATTEVVVAAVLDRLPVQVAQVHENVVLDRHRLSSA